MAIVHFTKEEFEKALHDNQPNGIVVQNLGLISNEYCYLIHVTNNAGILIRSSVDSFGTSGGLGEDSIRIYPTECSQSGGFSLHGSSDVRWITRQPGWENRLQYSIKKLSRMIQDAGSCSECGKPLKILKVKKEGKNKGKWFAACVKEHNQFKWLEEE